MNRSGSVGVVGRRGVGLKPYILLAAASIFTLLMSCGDNIIEGGKSGPAGSDLKGTINVHVRNGAGNGAFTSAADSVYVTLIDAGTRPQLLGANGSVNFTNLTEGSYEVRVEKRGYATAYYTAKILQDEVTGNTGKVVNIPAVLYKLDAGLSGTVRYEKPDGSSGYAEGAVVRLEIGVNRTTEVVSGEDIKIENRFFDAEVGADGKYDFGKVLPNVPAGSYTLTVLGFSVGGVDFENAIIYDKNGPSLKSEGVTVAKTMLVDPSYVVTELTVVSWSASLSESKPLEIEFNTALVDLGKSTRVIKANGVKADESSTGDIPLTVSYSGKKLVAAPDWAWNKGGALAVKFTVSGLRSSAGVVLDTYTGVVSVTDAIEQFFALTNVPKEGTSLVYRVSDTASTITLEFNKEIDTAKLSTKFYQDILPSEAYKTEVDGKTVKISPVASKWKNLSVAGGTFNLTLSGIVAVDNDVLNPDPTVVKVELRSTQQKFVIASAVPEISTADVIKIKSTDDDLELSLTLSLPLSKDAKDGVAPSVKVGGKQVEFEFVGTSGIKFGPRKGTTWSDAVNKATGEVAIILGDFFSTDDQPLEKVAASGTYSFTVKKALVGTFYYGGADFVEIADSSAEINLYFSEALESSLDLKSALTLTPDQPFVGSFADGGKTITLKPVTGVNWAFTNGSLKIGFVEDVFQIGESGVFEDYTFEVEVGFQQSVTGVNLLANVSIEKFELDTAQSYWAALPAPLTAASSPVATPVKVIWSAVNVVGADAPGLSGYQVHIYKGKTHAGPATGVVQFINGEEDMTATSNAGGVWDKFVKWTGSGETDYDDPVALYVGIVPVPVQLKDGDYTLVIRPYYEDGGETFVGEPTVLGGVFGRPIITGLTPGAAKVTANGNWWDIPYATDGIGQPTGGGPATVSNQLTTFLSNAGNAVQTYSFIISVTLDAESDSVTDWATPSVTKPGSLSGESKYLDVYAQRISSTGKSQATYEVRFIKTSNSYAPITPASGDQVSFRISGKAKGGRDAVFVWSASDHSVDRVVTKSLPVTINLTN